MQTQIRTGINTLLDVDYEAEMGGFVLHHYIGADGIPDPTAWTVTHKESGIAVGSFTTHELAQMALKYFSEIEVGGVGFGQMEMCEVITVTPLLRPSIPNHLRTDCSIFSPAIITPEIAAELCP